MLKFNGIRITQSDTAISIDQSEYILGLLLIKHFGHNPEKVKTLSTPMQYDSKFEKELTLAPPLASNELKHVAINTTGPCAKLSSLMASMEHNDFFPPKNDSKPLTTPSLFFAWYSITSQATNLVNVWL